MILLDEMCWRQALIGLVPGPQHPDSSDITTLKGHPESCNQVDDGHWDPGDAES